MIASAVTAPEFSLPSVSGDPVRLADLQDGGRALLLFVSEECPTSVMTLRRLGPIVAELTAAGVRVAAVFEDPLEVAARTARRASFPGVVLSEPAPYEVSRAYSLESLPTAVLVDRSGRQTGRVVGWDAAGLRALLSVPVTDEPPLRKPGCAAKNTYDPEELRLIEGSGYDELEEMFERGWTDGLPVIPPTIERVEAMLGGRDRSRLLGEMAPAMARVTLERVAACAVLAGCQPEYFPVVVAAVEAVLEPAFNVGGQAVTTQPSGQVLVVNGRCATRSA
jgi:peroxiredoxin